MSEFGKGLCYCLALFLCHSERMGIVLENSEDSGSYSVSLWFNAASDHLYDLEIPSTLSRSLQRRLKAFQKRVIHFGHGFERDATEEDKTKAIQEAKDLVRLIDRAHGISVSKGDYE